MKHKKSVFTLSAIAAIAFSGCGEDYKWDTNNTSKLEGQYTLEKVKQYRDAGNWYSPDIRAEIIKVKAENFLATQPSAIGLSISVKYHDDGGAIYDFENSLTNDELSTHSYDYAFGCAELNTSNEYVEGGLLPSGYTKNKSICIEPLTPTNRFKVGSLTKTATSRTILDMDDNDIEYPDFSINDPVTSHLPPDILSLGDLSGITISQLLHHTSGLGDFNTSRPAPVEDKISVALGKERFTEPGQMYKYNNDAYVILGQVIEYETGHKWQKEVLSRLTEAVGDNNSFIFPKESDDGNYTKWLTTFNADNHITDVNKSLARGYELGNGYEDITAKSGADIAYSAGALIASVPDVTKWMESIATNDNVADGNTNTVGLLSKEYFKNNLDTMNTTTYANIYVGSTNWNLGAGIGYDQTQNSLFHLGNFPGYICHSVFSKNENVTVTICLTGHGDVKKFPYELLDDMYPYRTTFNTTKKTK